MAKKHSHNYIYISKSELQSYYLVQKLTLKDIAEIYDCSISESKRSISVKHSGQFKKGLEPWNKDTQGYKRQDHRELVLNIVNQVYYGGEIL